MLACCFLLLENFNGTSAGTSLDPMSSRRRSTRLQSKLKCKSESTESIAVGNNEPVSDFEPNPSSSQAAPTTIAVLKENAGKDMKPSKETLSLLPRRQSLRIQNKKNGNREATSETSVNLAEVEVYIENAETGTASNPVLVEDENFVRITIGGAPKRKHSTSVYKNTKLKSEPPKEEQIKEETGNMNGSSKQKRGRKSKVSMAVAATVKKDDLLNGGKFASGQRGKSEMGTGLDLHCPDETISMRNCELYYTAPLIKDPLSGNIYYRTVQYVYIPEENVFQCSTCSTFIQGDSKYMLKEKFHRHYIKFHSGKIFCLFFLLKYIFLKIKISKVYVFSDRFICRLCPGSNHFQNDLELHQHFGRCHQGSLHYEPNIQSTTRQQRSIIKPPRQKLSQSQLYKQRKLCTICLMPTNTFDDNQIEEHRMSHMNEEEVVVYLRVKQKDNALDVRKARQSEAKVKGQFTSDWKGDDTGSLGNKKLSGRWGRKRGPYRKSLKAEKTEGTTENWNMCPTCGQLVAHGDTGMNKHIRFHHQIDNAADADDVVVNDEKGLICHHCQMGFSSSFVFRNHLAKVHDEEVPLASSVGKTKRKRRKSSEEYTVPAHLRRASVNSQYTVQTRRSSRYFSNTQNSDENANVT